MVKSDYLSMPLDHIVCIPNDETLRAFTETDCSENLIEYKDADGIFRSLGL
jgi:hypothetical protein